MNNKITFFIGEFCGGGAERVISILANKLVDDDFDVNILKYYSSNDFYHLDKRIKTISIEENTHTKNIFANFLWLRKYLRDNVDIFISFLAPFNMFSLFANFFINKPIIVADRNDPRIVPNNLIMKLIRNVLYLRANGLVFQTNDNLQYFSKSIQRKSIVIANPFEKKDYLGIALNAKKENKIVSVARLEKQKNIELLIESFAELSELFPKLRLDIYGEGSNRDSLQMLIESLCLQNRISLMGNIKDIVEQIKKSKLFVLTSNYEGMSNSLIEAMCIGLPVISTKVSGAKELIINNENGILIDVNNKTQLIEAIKKVLLDNEFSNKLSSNAIKIYDCVDVDNVVKEWKKFINSIKK